ncbi:ATPase WRNIP1 [Myotis davidii]|uniref:ATPase WRNIP1 n=1 Tax=Myotis davidii TaxID=225400 RepID=L5LHI9_MYODS|nr:ATPase WRNIP1 [Myotis davidii]
MWPWQPDSPRALPQHHDFTVSPASGHHCWSVGPGEERYHCISALHKLTRGSGPSASLYWLACMLEGGEDPLYVASRLCAVYFARAPKSIEVDGAYNVKACLRNHQGPLPLPAAPEEPVDRAHEGPGLWQGLQIPPHVQRACGPGTPARRIERRGFLQAQAMLAP